MALQDREIMACKSSHSRLLVASAGLEILPSTVGESPSIILFGFLILHILAEIHGGKIVFIIIEYK